MQRSVVEQRGQGDWDATLSVPPSSGRSVRPRSPAQIIEPGRGPERPQGRGGRMSRENRRVGSFVRFVSGVLTLAFVLLAAAGGIGLYLYHQYQQTGPLTQATTVAIPKGEGRIQIAQRLEREGVISNRWSFLVSHLVTGFGEKASRSELKAGEYAFPANVSMKEVLEKVTLGRSIGYKLTIPEGLTTLQIVARVNAMEHLTGEITEMPQEGSMMPDTYQIAKGTSRADVLKRMQTAQQAFIDKMWETRAANLPIKTKQEAIILASIVEKETGIKSERQHVASVFMNRLNKGMRLESDPTIIYGLVGGKGSLGRGITKTERKQKTPYNTYTIKGLPPTPIASPGRKAIMAVLNPAATNDYFFVADGTGGHKFSETFREHIAAVKNWRKIERAAKANANAGRASSSTRAVSIPVTPGGSDSPNIIKVTKTKTISTTGQSASGQTDTANAPPAQEPEAVAAENATPVPLPERKPDN
ncbi:MAG: endolytic transglycosylase MltG [Hyphomicrobiaceae bacterium]